MLNSTEMAKLIKETAKKRGHNTGSMLVACGLSKNTLSSMQSGGYRPRLENLVKIADYLEVSVDYLLGRTDYPEINNGQFEYDGIKQKGIIENTETGYIFRGTDND